MVPATCEMGHEIIRRSQVRLSNHLPVTISFNQ